jgi:hypothetical protein
MRRLLVSIVSVVGVLAALGSPAQAITGTFIEDDEHPFVGLVVFYDASGEFTQRCSGSLLTPTAFLTAGHCTAGARTARVYFQQDAGAGYDADTGADPVSGYPQTCAPGTLGTLCATSDEVHDLGFDFARLPDTRDAGLVVLDQPIRLDEYGALAAAGSLDRLATQRGLQDVTFTASGYGLTRSSPVGVTSFRKRLMAESRLTNLSSSLTGGFNLQTNGNGKGRGGTCSGDSGGPVFSGGYTSSTIVAVTSFGQNAYCRGVGFAYRTDRAEVLAWIRATLGEEQYRAIEVVSVE